MTFEKVLELRRQNSNMKAVRIAEICGVSRERIRQILKKVGLATHNFACYKCEKCGKATSNKDARLCWHCHTIQFRTQFQCEVCHKTFYVRNGIVKYKGKFNLRPRFCSNKCKGKIASRNLPSVRRKLLAVKQ